MKFNPNSVPLKGIHLIEASAGTGKTFSISLLTLRLLLENEIPIEKILLVTFTESAASELKDRTIKFINQAINELKNPGLNPNNPTKNTLALVANKSNSYKISLLQTALLDIDKATMSTIHSFCLQTLTEFAFETNQIYGRTLQKDFSAFVRNELEEFWRTEVSILDYNPDEKNIAFETFLTAVNNKLNGSEFCHIQNSPFILTHEYIEKAITIVNKKVKAYLNRKNVMTFDDLISELNTSSDNLELKTVIRKKYSAVFVDEFQDTDIKQYTIFKKLFQEDPNKIVFYIGDPKQSIYAFRNADLAVYFEARNSIHPDNLWSMDKNYRSSMRYITAMNTFFQPSSNYNSFNPNNNASISIAYQILTSEGDNKDHFGVKHKKEELKALNIIEVGKKDEYGVEIDPDPAIVLLNCVKFLLNKDTKLNGRKVVPSDIGILVNKNKEGKSVKSILADAGIPAVVIDETNIFSTEEAKDLSELLLAVIQPSPSQASRALLTVTAGYKSHDLSRLNFDDLIYQLKQLHDIWLTQGIFVMMQRYFTLFDFSRKLQEDATHGPRMISNLRQLTEILQKKAQQESLSPFELFNFLIEKIKNNEMDEDQEYAQGVESDEDAIKITTIHKSKGLEYNIVILPELILKNAPNSYHKFFSFKKRGVPNFVLYHDTKAAGIAPDYGQYKNLYSTQKEEENRRLIYVGVTRAKYNTFIISKTRTKTKTGYHAASIGSIHAYIDAIRAADKGSMFYEEAAKFSGFDFELATQVVEPSSLCPFPSLTLPDKNYHKLSYSFLAAKHANSPKEETQLTIDDDYNRFVFKELPKGANVGNLLHTIFEFIDFTLPDTWDARIKSAILRYLPSKNEDEVFFNQIKLLVQQVLHASINIDAETIQLKDVLKNKRINELEFNFPITSEFEPIGLETILDATDPRRIVTNKGEVKGMMNGLIDLFFEWKGKYYILDWKSNFLGDTLEQYHPDLLNDAMNENNYHLQYLIYTVAVDLYLKSRLGDEYSFEKHFGGVMYLFLRGLRENSNHGIYIQREDYNTINTLKEKLHLAS